METEELNHKATARRKEWPERWVGWYELPQPLLAVRGCKRASIWRPGVKQRRSTHGVREDTGNGKTWAWINSKEWKQSQKWLLGFVAVFIWKHCGGWAVATRSKEMNSDLLGPPTNCCWCKSSELDRVEGGRKPNPDYKTTENQEQHHVSVHVFMSHAACARGERAERQRWREKKNERFDEFSESTNGGCCLMAPLTAGAINHDRTN